MLPSDIIEHALAHKLKDEAEAAYQRGDLLLKRAYVTERWPQFCSDPSDRIPDIAKLPTRRFHPLRETNTFTRAVDG